MTDDDPSDSVVLAAIAVAHDPSALRIIYDRHHGWIRARLRRRCGDDDVVFEAVQDTFVAVWRSAGSYNGSGDPAAWLWGIAIRRLIGAQRTRSRWPKVALEVDVEQTDPGLDRAGANLDLIVALGTLAPELLAVVRATYFDGLSIAETGELLDLPDGTVKTRVMRAKALLRGALQ